LIQLKSLDEIYLLHEAAQLVSKTLGMLAPEIKPGVTTLHLDKLAYEFIKDHGAQPVFLGYGGFPNSLCTSPNEQVVHGIPNDQPLKDGDIISVDCGTYLNGYVGDQAYTFEVGEVAPEIKKLLKVTKASLYKGIEQCIRGKRIGDISHAIQEYCENEGYGVVRELVGHGVGKVMHEDPQVPNYGRQGSGKVIKDGLVIAIEPMITLGTEKVKFHDDGWTVTTLDNKAAAHFEHDVAVVHGKPVLLSTYQYINDALGIKTDEEAPFQYEW